jgi:hypothetical protein
MSAAWIVDPWARLPEHPSVLRLEVHSVLGYASGAAGR